VTGVCCGCMYAGMLYGVYTTNLFLGGTNAVAKSDSHQVKVHVESTVID